MQPVLFQLARGFTVIFPFMMIRGSAYADIALSIITLLFLLHSAIAKDWAWLKARPVQILLLIWAYITLRSLFTPDMQDMITRSLPWIRYPLFAAALGWWLLRDRFTRHYCFMALMATVAFLVGDTLLQYWRGEDLFGFPYLLAPSGEIRLTGPYHDPKIGIILMWLSLPVLLTLLTGKLAWQKLAASMSVAAFLVVVLLSGERAAFLLSMAGLLTGFALLPMRLRFKCALATIMLLSAATILATRPQLLERQVHSTIESIAHFSDTPYGKLWHSALIISRDHPLFGVGPRQFRTVCTDAAYGGMDDAQVRCNLHPHNIYLEWLVETGAIGLGLFIWFLCHLARSSWQQWRKYKHNPIFLGIALTLTIRLLPVISSASFFTSWVAVSFWFFMGGLFYFLTDERAA